ncbi:hypothetical protein Vafri_10666 [Volvox africanus]|uniref:Uncharacterized protein n=1 Tax=Volvox africanus TaxID=51714 RepID=A0A8J4B6Q4_9CHLO|nr:hypothetical protein Vafri_10666 [Volvox africanus]
MRPSSLSPFALYAGPLITTSIAAAVSGSSATDPEIDAAAGEEQDAESQQRSGHGSEHHPTSAVACTMTDEGSRQQAGPSQPQQLSAYAMALYQELQAAEPLSPDAAAASSRRSLPPTRGSAGPPAAPMPHGHAPQALALTEAPSQQSSQLLFNSREYGLYGLYEPNGMQEQLITGYYTSLPSISPRSYRDSSLQPTPRNLRRFNTASGTYVQLRNRFLRNVFGLLALSLAVAAGAGVAVLAAPPDVASRLLLSQPWALHLTLVLSIGTLLLLALSERLRRPHPHSLLAFVAFSAGQTLLVATATVALDTCLLVQAVGLAALALACVAACAQLLGRLADLTTGAAIAWCSAGVVLGWAGGAALEAVVAGSAGSGASGIGLCCCSWVDTCISDRLRPII